MRRSIMDFCSILDIICANAKYLNNIIHGGGWDYFWEGIGPLSIKSFYNGQAFYNTGRGYHAVNDLSYLILNHAQPYSITIESDTLLESFCIFFAPGFVEEVHRSLT